MLFDIIQVELVESLFGWLNEGDSGLFYTRFKERTILFHGNIINYVIKTYKKFKGHPIAGLGDWVVQRKYVIKTTVSNPKNIVYRFTAI